MRISAWRAALFTLLLLASIASAADPTVQNYEVPKDIGAGFSEKTMLGDPPKPQVEPIDPLSIIDTVLARIWSGGIEVGLNGSTGNSDVVKFRTGFNAKRDAEGNLMKTDLMYVMSEVSGKTTENKALWGLDDEMQMGQSNWGMLMAENIEFDQFRFYNFRNAMHGGMSRTLVKESRLMLKVRFGAGMSYDLDTITMGDRWVPEGMLGYDFECKLTDRVRLTSYGDYYPDMSNWGQFRLRVRAAGEYLIAPEFGLVLRAGIQERYDSAPGGGLPNDLDFFTTLMLKF